MPARITARLIELTYEAALKSFWRKNALRKFLRASHLSSSYIGSWASDETKRDFLDRAFDKLQGSDKRKAVILQMARNLAEQKSFPDLRSWEDSDVKIRAAQKAVAELQGYLEKHDQEIRSEQERDTAKKRAHEERAKIRRALSDKASLQSRLDSLHSKVGTQEGGYEFEEWFYDSWTTLKLTIGAPIKSMVVKSTAPLPTMARHIWLNSNFREHNRMRQMLTR